MKNVDFDRMIGTYLKEMGFQKKGVHFIKQINKDNLGLIGFSFVGGKGFAHIEPIISICNIPIEDLLEKLLYKGKRGYQSATIGGLIRYLIPSEPIKYWEFLDNQDNSKSLNEMLQTIKTYGLPFIEKYLDINELQKCLEERCVRGSAPQYKLPVLYYLQGNKNQGNEYVFDYIRNKNQPFPKEKMGRDLEQKKESINIMLSFFEKKQNLTSSELESFNKLKRELERINNPIYVPPESNIPFEESWEGKRYMMFFENYKKLQ